MSADRSEKNAENRFGGRLRSGGHNAGRSAQGSGLRDAIAFLNRESVSLPAPEAPPWEARPNPAGTPAPHRPDPPLAPVRELRPPAAHPAQMPGQMPAPLGNGSQFPVAPDQQHPQWPATR
ncbi:MAG: hypothetical protein HOW97_31470, partial [Catenulispora sp.]|nr:hypothetical protein [Catenulispora sp.]